MRFWTAPPVVRINHAGLSRALVWLEAHRPIARPRLLLVSPSRHDVLFLRRRLPSATLTIVTIRDWNLDQPPALEVGPFDWAIASNVMHYASAPQRWIDHLLMASPVVVIQDLVDRRRGPMPPYLAADGDRMRYQHSGAGIVSSFAGAFDLVSLVPVPTYFEAFDGVPNDLHAGLAAPTHFCAVLVTAGSAATRTGRRHALAELCHRWRLTCYRHLPLYLVYKAADRWLRRKPN